MLGARKGIIIIIKTYLCRMTISVIKTAINMGPALKKEKTRSKKSYIRNLEIIHMKRDKKTKTRIHIQLLKISAPL